MTPTQLAEAAAMSLQNGLSQWFSTPARRDLRDYWRTALAEAGFLPTPPIDYLDLLVYAETMAGLRTGQAPEPPSERLIA